MTAREVAERPCIDQTVLGVGNPRANCLQAALATMLGKRLADVIDVTDPAIEPNWHDHLESWAAANGWRLWSTAQRPKTGYYIACGPTEKRTGKHAVVCLDDRVYHDPHPSRDGITEAHFYILAVRAELIAMAGEKGHG